MFEQENLLQKANVLGQKLKDGLLAIAEKHPEIGDVRGLGAMIAIEPGSYTHLDVYKRQTQYIMKKPL